MTTIGQLRTYPKPASLPAKSRIGTVERTAYQVTGTLLKYKLEGDSDLHLVVADSVGRTLVVEIPDPAWISVARPVGFYGFLHGQSGMAPNGLELHAVTGIAF